ncbi:MAG: M1 family aminopeptidase [Bacteroidia bacterium]
MWIVVFLQLSLSSTPRSHPVDMLHMRLEVRFAPKEKRIEGKVTHTFRVLRDIDSLVLDGIDLQIEDVSALGQKLRFRNTGREIILYFPTRLRSQRVDSVTLRYTVLKPQKGIYFIGWDDPTHRNRKQIWTQGQATDHRYWIPAYDDMNDKLITETVVEFDPAYEVLSNGTLLDTSRTPEGLKRWHYRMQKPHALYLLMLAIGKYDIEKRQTLRGIPLRLYYYPDKKACVEPTYRYSVEMVEFLERELDVPYPWESYSQVPVQDFIYGAMENTTATIFGDFFLVDDRAYLDRNYIAVNVHELTHQWFGDYVTARSGAHLWLQESFATFYSKLFNRVYFGEDTYQWERRTEHTVALAAAASDNLPIVHPNPGYARVYQKGSAVLDMMRYTFGEEPIRRVITHFLRRHPYQNVETNDLYQSFQDTLGIAPDWFFTQWLYRGGEPHYAVRYQPIQKGGKAFTQVFVEQIQDSAIGLFRMPIGIEVHYQGGGKDSVRVWIEKAQQVVEILNLQNKPIAFVLFDPQSWILKRVQFAKSEAELIAQAENAPYMIDRYDAVVAMRSWPREKKRELFTRLYDKERFWAIRAEMVRQLVGDMAAQALIRKAVEDPHPQVRYAALMSNEPIPASLRPVYEKLLKDSSYTVQAYAAEKLATSFPALARKYAQALAGSQGIGHSVEIEMHELLALDGDKNALEKLVDLTSPSYDFRTRQNALEALRRLNTLPPAAIPHLFDALVSTHTRLAATAKTLVQYWMEQTLVRRRLIQYYRSRSWEPKEKKILELLLSPEPPPFYRR